MIDVDDLVCTRGLRVDEPLDLVAVATFAAFLQAIPEVRAGRACWTQPGLDYAGVTWATATELAGTNAL